jgi:hypothetical protein
MGIFDKLFGSKKEEKKATVNRLISEPLINKEPENILQEIDFDLIDKAAEDDRISSNTIMHDYDFIKLIGQKNYIEESKSDEQIEEFILTFFGKQKLEILTAKIIQFNFIKEFLGVKLKDLTLKYKNKEFSGYKEIYMWHNCAEWAQYVIQKNLINMAAEGQEIKDVDPSVLRNLMSEVIDEAFDDKKETFKNSEGNISWTHEEKIAYLKIQLTLSYIKRLSDKDMMGVVFPNMEQIGVKILDSDEGKECWDSRKEMASLLALCIIEDMSTIKKSIVSKGIKLIALFDCEDSETEELLSENNLMMERLEKTLSLPIGWFMQTMVK